MPLSEKTGLESGEGGFAELIAALGDGGPVEIIAAAAGGFDQGDDFGAGPAGTAEDGGVVDAGLFDCAAIGIEMVCRRGDQGLFRAGPAVVGKVRARFVKTTDFPQDFCFIPNHWNWTAKPLLSFRSRQYRYHLRKNKNQSKKLD